MRGKALAGLTATIAELAGTELELERPADAAHGDYATNVAMRLAGVRRRAPREIAQELAARVAELPEIASADVAGPGFLNLVVADDFLAEALGEIDERYGAGSAAAPERVNVEMVSANPTGPIPVSAGRNGAYGDSVARLLAYAGHDVEREYYYNDAGRQLDLFRASVEAARRGEEAPDDGYRGDYIRDLAAHDGDPVPHMLHSIEATLERFRIHFDTFSLQSTLEQELPALLERLPTYERDGALWIKSTEFGDERDRVLIRSAERGGTPTYEAADIAYLRDKLERGFERVIYVLGADHFDVRLWYAVIARLLGYDPLRVEVLLYQLVHLTRGGEQTRMSKRRGDIVTLDEFMDEVGVDAARWYLVNRGPDQTIEIDVDLAAEKTQKNPVYYVQYAHARIAGILRNAPVPGTVPGTAPVQPLAREERELIKRLLEFPALVAEATERRAPQALPNYAIRVADDFHRFYHEHRVLESEQREFRLELVRATQHVIARCLDLIGVEAPERM
ncbi:MAG: arginine--tRNA ligase [Gaiellaceae bacterium]